MISETLSSDSAAQSSTDSGDDQVSVDFAASSSEQLLEDESGRETVPTRCLEDGGQHGTMEDGKDGLSSPDDLDVVIDETSIGREVVAREEVEDEEELQIPSCHGYRGTDEGPRGREGYDITCPGEVLIRSGMSGQSERPLRDQDRNGITSSTPSLECHIEQSIGQGTNESPECDHASTEDGPDSSPAKKEVIIKAGDQASVGSEQGDEKGNAIVDRDDKLQMNKVVIADDGRETTCPKGRKISTGGGVIGTGRTQRFGSSTPLPTIHQGRSKTNAMENMDTKPSLTRELNGATQGSDGSAGTIGRIIMIDGIKFVAVTCLRPPRGK